jgi:putative oxidoreductase
MALSDAAKRLEPLAYAAMRIVVGALFALHGVQKLFGWPSGEPVTLASQKGLGGLIELACGALIAVGAFTRPAAFLASGTMAVAYVQFHWQLELDAWRWLPAVNRGELAVAYCFLFLFVSAYGGGALSIDRRRGRA